MQADGETLIPARQTDNFANEPGALTKLQSVERLSHLAYRILKGVTYVALFFWLTASLQDPQISLRHAESTSPAVAGLVSNYRGTTKLRKTPVSMRRI